MVHPSHRGLNMTLSPIRSLLPFARKAKKEGRNVFHLNIGQPDIPTPPQAMEAIRAVKDRIISYGPSEGLPSLRALVAQYFNKFDAHVTADDIYVTTGASEAILFTLFATCDVGDEVIIPEPFYANYLGFAETSSIKIVPITTHIEEAFGLPSPEAFEQLITPRTRAIMLCNPGNPTGQLYTADQLNKILDLCKRHNLFMVVDEVYREFCYDTNFTSILSVEGGEDHVIVIDSISKVFSSCGARIGYLITKNEDIRNTVLKYAQLRLCPPYLGQVLAEACYRYGHDYIEEAKIEYAKRREVLYSGLNSIDGIKAYKPTAAFYNIVELPVPNATEFCKWMLSDFNHNGNTVMLAPAGGFYFSEHVGASQVRIAYILNENHLQQALECLQVGLKQYHKMVLQPAT